MMKTTFILFVLLTASCYCFATDNNVAEDLLAIINMKPTETTPDKVTSLFGQPADVEKNRKETIWHYNTANTHLSIYWNAKEGNMEKFSFTSIPGKEMKTEWDNALGRNLRTGQTVLADAFKTLGVPRDMTLKHVNQELHYKYQSNVLNLFFRKGRLVNYTLY